MEGTDTTCHSDHVTAQEKRGSRPNLRVVEILISPLLSSLVAQTHHYLLLICTNSEERFSWAVAESTMQSVLILTSQLTCRSNEYTVCHEFDVEQSQGHLNA